MAPDKVRKNLLIYRGKKNRGSNPATYPSHDLTLKCRIFSVKRARNFARVMYERRRRTHTCTHAHSTRENAYATNGEFPFAPRRQHCSTQAAVSRRTHSHTHTSDGMGKTPFTLFRAPQRRRSRRSSTSHREKYDIHDHTTTSRRTRYGRYGCFAHSRTPTRV